MKVTIKKEIDVKDTDTVGKHAYLVAELWGGIMEDPEFHHENYRVIRADSEDEAEQKYNKLNNCSYYYADVIQMLE